jgi:KUP system potassium uptake protein
LQTSKTPAAKMAHAGAGGGLEIVPHSSDLELDLPPENSLRQDSLYRDATRPAHHAGHHGQVHTVTQMPGLA